ncbi:hypothetical protein HanPSC8_Chr05g0202061 [Helianthus annuus]|nr:hypothetical protein HanPSC8_Chr05g0202061 [Helianthus annuus]
MHVQYDWWLDPGQSRSQAIASTLELALEKRVVIARLVSEPLVIEN